MMCDLCFEKKCMCKEQPSFPSNVNHLDWCNCSKCKEVKLTCRCGVENCFGGCIPFGYAIEDSVEQPDGSHKVKVRINADFDCGHFTVKESYQQWRTSLSKSHWNLYRNMPNTLSEDAFAAGYLAGKRRGNK